MTAELVTFVVIILGLGNLALLVWLVFRLNRKSEQPESARFDAAIDLLKAELLNKQSESLLTLRRSIDEANRMIDSRLSEGSSALDKRLKVFGEIENQLGALSRQAGNIETVGKNIQSLSDLLRPPKVRGKVGEMLLENLLSQILPAALYDTQYRFPDGVRVDAVVRLGEKLLPVDAKFPLESFERLTSSPEDAAAAREFKQALKKHIDAIAEKYVRPEGDCLDVAVMYIPAEAVYYRLVASEDSESFEYALSRKVIPSSPGHFYGFLASVAAIYSQFTLASSSLQQGGRHLAEIVSALSESLDRFERLHDRMDGSLRSLRSGMEKSRAEISAIAYQLERLRSPDAAERAGAGEPAIEENVDL